MHKNRLLLLKNLTLWQIVVFHFSNSVELMIEFIIKDLLKPYFRESDNTWYSLNRDEYQDTEKRF